MSDLVQKIADAVEVVLGDDGHCVVYKNAAVKEAIRQSLGSTERGEAVAWGVQKTGEDGVWFVSDSRVTAQHYATAYAHRVSDGKPDQTVIPLYTTPDAGRVAELEDKLHTLTVTRRIAMDSAKERSERIATLEQQLTESQEREGRMREALIEVSATLAWTAHGECRAIHDGPIMPSAMAIEAAKAALAADKEQK